MPNRLFFAVFLLIFTMFVGSMSMMVATSNDPVATAIRPNRDMVPCIVSQVDGHLFASGAQIPVHTVSTFSSNCPVSPFVEERNGGYVFHDPLWFSLDRWISGEWIRTADQPATLPVGAEVRHNLVTYTGLSDGRYRLTVVNGEPSGPWYFLEAINFIVGGIQNQYAVFEPRFDLEDRVPYVKPAKVVDEGTMYFRGFLGDGIRFANGYLYQVQVERKTTVFPVGFEVVDPQDESIFTNRQEVRGGALDLNWVRVILPRNSFNPGRPVYASITANGDGTTIQGMVYDPTDPAALVTGFNASR